MRNKKRGEDILMKDRKKRTKMKWNKSENKKGISKKNNEVNIYSSENGP